MDSLSRNDTVFDFVTVLTLHQEKIVFSDVVDNFSSFWKQINIFLFEKFWIKED